MQRKPWNGILPTALSMRYKEVENIMENTYRILAQGRTVCNDTWQTELNNNDLVIGPSGSGKTRGYVKPNIIQCNESMIITDTKGALYSEIGGVLEQEGYKVINLNLADCDKSPYGYNPLAYIRCDSSGKYSEQDILTLAACIVPIETVREPYWENMARIYLESAISYMFEALPAKEHTFSSVLRLTGEMGEKGKYKKLMDELSVIDSESFALSRYRMFKSVSENVSTTSACIHSFLASKLAPLSFDGAKKLFNNRKKINIKELGRRKTAVFLTVSDTDDSMYRLANIFYTQALHTLCSLADKNPEHRLKIPVRFYLDDFASNAVIPDFDRIISVIRSREISVSIILQSISQLESIYGRAKAMTIINNCDNLLCLGSGRDLETARYISYQVNKPVSAILNTPLNNAWLLTRGSKAVQVAKYDLKKHRFYNRLPEAQHNESIEEIQPENCI